MAYTPGTLSAHIGASKETMNEFRYITADALAAVTGSGYFSDGRLRGMQTGDTVLVGRRDGSEQQRFSVTAVDAATGAATVTAIANLT